MRSGGVLVDGDGTTASPPDLPGVFGGYPLGNEPTESLGRVSLLLGTTGVGLRYLTWVVLEQPSSTMADRLGVAANRGYCTIFGTLTTDSDLPAGHAGPMRCFGDNKDDIASTTLKFVVTEKPQSCGQIATRRGYST